MRKTMIITHRLYGFVLITLFSCGFIFACHSVPEQDQQQLIGKDDAFRYRAIYEDRNIPPYNWMDIAPEWIENPYYIDWGRARQRDGWLAVRPREEEKYWESAKEIREFYKQIQRGNINKTNSWELAIISNKPPQNWGDVVPDWIKDPNAIDWAKYRLSHGWLIVIDE